MTARRDPTRHDTLSIRTQLRCRRQVLMLAASTALSQWLVAGTVGTDGSMGAAHSLAGPNFQITADLGVVRGKNLFHSLSTLNLDAGESATFSGPSSVKDVLTRITGGPSSIDGTLRCTIPHANFYLINPAGMLFGPNAALDLSGSFTVTTANQVKLADGKVFGASGSTDAALTSAAPAAFGFLSASPNPVLVNGATLAVRAKKNFLVAAGTVGIVNGGIISAPQGGMSVLSVASPTNATIRSGHAPAPAAGATLGEVSLAQNAYIKASGDGGGRLEIRANNLNVIDSTIESLTNGASDGQGIDIQLTGTLSGSDDAIFANTLGTGRGGDVRINARSIEQSNGVSARLTGIDSRSYAAIGGDGGNVRIHADTISLADGQQFNTNTSGSGHGGSIEVVANRFSMRGFANNPTAAPSGVSAAAQGTGHGGSIRIHADTLRVDDGGFVLSGSSASGAGGTTSITADQLIVHGGTVNNPTGITSFVAATSDADTGPVSVSAHDIRLLDSGDIGSSTLGKGGAGPVTVHADHLTIDGGNIVSETLGPGRGGSVDVNAGQLRMDGTNSEELTRIAASGESGSSGAAGNVRVSAKLAVINAGAEISSDTYGSGVGGNVDLRAGTIQMDGRGSNVITSIDADARVGSSGHGGSVRVKADSISLVAGGAISSDTDGAGGGGNVDLVAGGLKLDGRGSHIFSHLSASSEGVDTGDAGRLRIHAGDVRVVNGARIDNSTNGRGAGGDISLTAKNVVVDGAGASSLTAIVAETAAGSSGNAGNLAVRADSVQILSSGAISTNTQGSGAGGDVSLTAHSLMINGHNAINATGIAAGAPPGSTGNAGSVKVAADVIDLVAAGSISSETFAPGDAGSVQVEAGQLTIDGRGSGARTRVSTASGLSTGDAGSVSVRADSISLMAGGNIQSATSGGGAGGDIVIDAGQVKLDGRGSDSFTGVTVDTIGASAKAGGSIRLSAKDLSIRNTARVDNSSFSPGNGGNIDIDADRIAITGSASPLVTGVTAVSNAGGDSGSINVHAQSLNLFAGGSITAEAGGTGRGGDVTVHATHILAERQDAAIQTQIDASAASTNAGAAGSVSVVADTITLKGALIDSTNYGPNAGGNVDVTANVLTADSTNASAPAGVSATAPTGSKGSAGAIHALIAQLNLGPGGVISTSTDSVGSGGDIVLRGGDVHIDDAGADLQTGVISDASVHSSGAAGSVSVAADTVELLNGGRITSNTFSVGPGGDVLVNARDILIDRQDGEFATVISAASVLGATGPAGNVKVTASGNLTIQNVGGIEALSLLAAGGDVAVTANNLTLRRGVITTSAAGAGGNIDIGPGSSFIIYPGSIVAAASGGANRGDNGGNVTIGRTALVFLPPAGPDTISATANQGNGGNITIDSKTFLREPSTPINAIDSSSLGGIAGTIVLSSPNVDLSGELVPLVAGLASQAISLAPTCSVRVGINQSSFTLEGGNGLPGDFEANSPSVAAASQPSQP